MRLSQTKFFRKIFIYFFALASMLTTCDTNDLKKEENKDFTTQSKKSTNKTDFALFAFISVVCIIAGGLIYKYGSSEAEQTESSLSTSSSVLGQKQQGHQPQFPIHNFNPRAPSNFQQWIDNESSQSSSSNDEYHSDEEKEQELNQRQIGNNVAPNEDDRSRGTGLLARRQEQGNQSSWQALREPEQVDTEVQDYLNFNDNDDQLSATVVLDNARQDKKNETNSVEDNDDIPGLDVEEQKRRLEYWNSQKKNIVHSNSQTKQQSKPVGKEKKFEEFCGLCRTSIVPNTQGVMESVFTNNYFNNVARTEYCCRNYLHYGCIKRIKEQYSKQECIVCRNTVIYQEWLNQTYKELNLQAYPEPEETV